MSKVSADIYCQNGSVNYFATERFVRRWALAIVVDGGVTTGQQYPKLHCAGKRSKRIS